MSTTMATHGSLCLSVMTRRRENGIALSRARAKMKRDVRVTAARNCDRLAMKANEEMPIIAFGLSRKSSTMGT